MNYRTAIIFSVELHNKKYLKGKKLHKALYNFNFSMNDKYCYRNNYLLQYINRLYVVMAMFVYEHTSTVYIIQKISIDIVSLRVVF